MQDLARGLARLDVVAHRLVPHLAHALPLGHDVVVLGGPVHGLGAVARRRVLEIRADSAAQVEGTVLSFLYFGAPAMVLSLLVALLVGLAAWLTRN